ncbi:MAG: D-glycero-beta-D-manno-heptose 1,7-bisphosphate 7-phosphatase [Roseiflexaceae bacterium]
MPTQPLRSVLPVPATAYRPSSLLPRRAERPSQEPVAAVFLDRDGVINENRDDHVKSWSEFCFLPGTFLALRRLRRAGLPVFVITNQAVISRGLVAPAVLDDIHYRMQQQIRQNGGLINDIRHCPHDSHEACGCRKPQPGMLFDLASHWNIDLGRSYLVGDAWTDMAAGHAAGCRCILVKTGRGTEHARLPEARQYPAEHIAPNLLGAVAWLLHQEHAHTQALALG